MKKTPIKFGTDGWRAVIGDDFTFDNVKRISQAVCDALPSISKNKLIVIGYDHRFFSERFAIVAAQVAQGNGYKVELSSSAISSPTLSFTVHKRKAAIGIMITASHNPFTFNGFKLKGAHGGSVDPVVTDSVENMLDRNVPVISIDEIKRTDFISDYVDYLREMVSVKSFGKMKKTIVFDSMNGPGAVILQKVLGEKSSVKFIRSEIDPLFGGGAPEPVEKYLSPLKNEVIHSHGAIGLAVDGDADRIGVIDDQGQYLPPQTVMPLLLLHLIENKKMKGKVVQTVSMGYLPGRIAHKYKLPFEEVPVGYKYIAERVLQEKVLFGGEESGGYGVGLWGPERDGLLCSLLLMELLAQTQKSLSSLVQDLYHRFGNSFYKRIDFSLTSPVDKVAWTQRIVEDINLGLHGLKIKNINPIDGVKIYLEDDSWVLMRPSGTEPLIRTYSEGTSLTSVDDLLKQADRWAHLPTVEEKKAALDDLKKKNKQKKLLKK